jgi:hypothetical protein
LLRPLRDILGDPMPVIRVVEDHRRGWDRAFRGKAWTQWSR